MACCPAWRILATFEPYELLSASFDCHVHPPPPGLQTRIGALEFLAPTCVAELRAAAPW
jgi:hypothetical protein